MADGEAIGVMGGEMGFSHSDGMGGQVQRDSFIHVDGAGLSHLVCRVAQCSGGRWNPQMLR